MSTAEQSACSDFTVAPVSPVIGAEVIGLDVSRPLDPPTLAVVRDAFQKHHMLCFRDQRLVDDQLVAFSTQFGALETFPEKGTVRGTWACQQIPTARGFKRQFDAIRQGRPIG